MAVTPEPSFARKLAVLGAGLAAILGLYALARRVGPVAGPLEAGVSVVLGLGAALLTGSLGEWAVHRYLMHRPLVGDGESRGRLGALFDLPYELHHRAHHWIQFPPDEYLQPGRVQRVPAAGSREGRVCRTGPGRALVVLGHVAFYSIFAALLAVLPAFGLAGNAVFAWTTTLTTALFLFLFVHVHDAVHHPGLSPLERFAWFRFLDRHHYVHHVDTRANTNFLLPLADWALGTLRRELTPAELAVWPSYEEARLRRVQPYFDEHGRKRRAHAPSRVRSA